MTLDKCMCVVKLSQDSHLLTLFVIRSHNMRIRIHATQTTHFKYLPYNTLPLPKLQQRADPPDQIPTQPAYCQHARCIQSFTSNKSMTLITASQVATGVPYARYLANLVYICGVANRLRTSWCVVWRLGKPLATSKPLYKLWQPDHNVGRFPFPPQCSARYPSGQLCIWIQPHFHAI